MISDVLCELDPVPPVGSLLPSLSVLHLQAAADTCVSTALSVSSPSPLLALAFYRGSSWCLHFAVSRVLLSLMQALC